MARPAQTQPTPSGATPALIRWGAVFGGMVIGLALLIVLTTLWMALGVGTGVEGIEGNLNWFIAGSAILAMFVGGMLAGWLSGVPGAGPGFFNGLTVWGLILIASIFIGAPGAAQLLGADIAGLQLDAGTIGGDTSTALWAGFVSLLVGAVAAGLGGALGGIMTRPAFLYAAPHAQVYREEAATDRHTTERREPADRPEQARSTGPGAMATPPPGREESTIRMPEDEAAGRGGDGRR